MLRFVSKSQEKWRALSAYAGRTIFLLLAVMVISGTFGMYGWSAARASTPEHTLVTIPHTIPAVYQQSKLTGSAPTSQQLSLSIGLRLRNANMLNSYLQDINRPRSLNYHRYLTPSQFAQVFSPAPAVYDALVQYLTAAGFTITKTYQHRLLIVFSGSVGLAERVFHVSINTYTSPNGQSFYSNSSDPQLPVALAQNVQGISGLNNAAHYTHAPIPTRRIVPPAHSSPHPNDCLGTGSSYYLPSQFASGYNLNGLYNQGYHGEGQTIALMEFDTFLLSDIQLYIGCYGQSNAIIQTVVTHGPVNSDDGMLEVELDAELVLSAAPALGQLRVYEASNDSNSTGLNSMLAQIVQDAPAVISDSWGACETSVGQSEAQVEANFFAAAAAQGQSIFVSSGDDGSEGCYNPNDPSPNSNLVANDPATQSYITAVGGTNLTLDSNNNYSTEAVWNDQGGASGGGISQFWTEPSSWQSAPGVNNGYDQNGSACNGPQGTICREEPDVSLNADVYSHGYLAYCTAVQSPSCQGYGPWLDVGGTSCAAPMWAAFAALVNEKSLRQGGLNIGFFNPLLYQIASNTNMYANDFHDIIITGNNDFTGNHGGLYPTSAVYDLATGLGSYNAANLASDLVTLALNQNGPHLTPSSAVWYFAEGSAGGGFQEYLTLENPSPNSIATVTITYLIQSQSAITRIHQVGPGARQTIDVDKDVNTSPTGVHYSLAAIVNSNVAIVAERPMYFNAVGVHSGSDVLGATHPDTSYYFPEADSTQSGQTQYNTFLTMLNTNNSQTAHVTITYYTGSCGGSNPACLTESITMLPLQRQTATPADVGLHQKLAIAITSDIPIVAERPLYFTDNIPNAGGLVSGAASEVGASSPGTDWLFAEGYTGTNFQQYYELADFNSLDAHTSIKLEYTNGSTQTIQLTVPAFHFVSFDVNYAYTHHLGVCNPSPCNVTSSVSAEITSDQPFVADRLMYFHYGNAQGCTDVVGLPAPAKSVYSFAEGYTGTNFQEFLTLQNPTASNEIVSITFFTPALILEQQVSVQAFSRRTLNVNDILHSIWGGSGSVSMAVQALGANTVIVAERPMYFNYGGIEQGGSDVIGFS